MWVFKAVAVVACLVVAVGSFTELDSDANLNPIEEADQSEETELREKRTPRLSLLQLLSAYSDDDYEDDYRPRRRYGGAGSRNVLVPIDLLTGGRRSSQIALPVLVLPGLAAPRAPHRTECDVRSGQDKDEFYDYEDNYPVTQRPRRPSTPRASTRRPDRDRLTRRPNINNRYTESDEDATPPPKKPSAPKKIQYPSFVRVEQLDQTITSPSIEPAVSSKELVEQFRAQAPIAPELPPVLFSEYDGSERVLAPEDEAPPTEPLSSTPTISVTSLYRTAPESQQSTASFGTNVRSRDPPRPRFNSSLVLRAELTVPRADFTEFYTAWYDAKSGSARVNFFDGSTSAYRTVMPDGSIQRLEARVDRSGEAEVRRCSKAASLQSSAADRAPPALPDIELFSFAGYTQTAGGRAERWLYTLAGRAGELGGARGEALTLRHELLLQRAAGGSARPLSYTVKVDSSVLGADCDGYQHRYLDAREFEPEKDFFTPNTDELCDNVQLLNASSAEHLARLEPWLEFTLPHRDLRYDAAIQRFKTEHNRKYLDDTEEAVRKNLLMQNLRFIRSGNREGATFEMASNYLGDRLDVELEGLRGLQPAPRGSRAERFPYARDALAAEAERLPDKFDWRPRGAVSPVRFQGASCASCWAFAVAGAVEGALFVHTRRLVPLSEKCLVDCAHPFGANGCNRTWPEFAFDYVQSRGLPALEEYPAYNAKVDTCAEKRVRPVTRISGYVYVTPNSVPALKVAIKKHAPSVVIIDVMAKSFQFYKKGVLYDDRCGKTKKKSLHAVLAVGWGSRKGEPHFILKNSWSEAWGDRGYVRLQARGNTCGVLSQPSYPRLRDADVLHDPNERNRVRPREADLPPPDYD